MESSQLKIKLLRLKKIYPVFLGALTGYLYFHFVGCVTGSCAITSSPWASTIVGAIIGASFIRKKRNQNNTQKISN